MPKLKETPKDRRIRMTKAFMTALRVGQAKRGEKDQDTAKFMPTSLSTYYAHLRDIARFTLKELWILIPLYFNDRQLCAMFGVEYHGTTPD